MGKKTDFEDDGRTIADMNLEGMPWYREKNKKSALETGRNTGGQNARQPASLQQIFSAMKGALAAGLLIGTIFVGAAFVFILFCVFIWLR